MIPIDLTASDVARFWKYVAKGPGANDCWLWTGLIKGGRYGALQVRSKNVPAHRLSYHIAYGPFPDDHFVLHRCDVPHCVRPNHLFLGTQGDNMRDAAAKGRLWLQRDPMRLVRMGQHGLKEHPERAARGDRHWSALHPELVRRGSRNHMTVLCEDQVREIRQLHKTGLRYKDLAVRFGVSPTAIGLICRRINWKYVE